MTTAAPLSGKRILVVDDNAINLDIAMETLAGAGAEVDSASSGRAALARLDRTNYDLVLLDLGMPDVDGWQVGRSLRAGTRNANAAMLLFTASDSSEAKRAVNELKAQGLVSKPVDVDVLLATAVKYAQS
jgi:CheY-like chemotaxis protein